MYFAGWYGVDKIDFPEAMYQTPSGWVTRGDIKGYFDETFHDAYAEWKYYKRFGLGNGSGWRNERELILKLIDIFESELESYQASKLKANK